jgi:hypothetical protein
VDEGLFQWAPAAVLSGDNVLAGGEFSWEEVMTQAKTEK